VGVVGADSEVDGGGVDVIEDVLCTLRLLPGFGCLRGGCCEDGDVVWRGSCGELGGLI